ncbi:aspartate aminotransferase [Capronia coronata CBS 617.96]|uniref:Aspartate aminotransferase n=1 Tax=Capronia coronata CBS 617.96 TaxID=1182541 RepID=W9YBY0_9EURO|nr:aspartate aminotransferase [Capronia coronata CBS 617.96]EXJ90352.1 aspartate aminotransferase [Capronia coronata CBS 617.96]
MPSSSKISPIPADSRSSSASASAASTHTDTNARLSQIQQHTMGSISNRPVELFDAVPQAPEDPLFGLMAAYRKDTHEKKVDLGIGAYRDNNAKPWVLPVVKKADKILRDDPDLNHEYLPIAGLPEFTLAAQKLILGPDSPAIKEGRATSLQTISGTGAVHLGGLFLSRFLPKPTPAIYLSNPTWANHNQIFTNIGMPIKSYPYFSAKTKMLDLDGLLSTLKAAPEKSIVLLHACAHNPTGVDPTQDQWKQIAEVCRERSLFPFFDCAYQGFASGDLATDNWAIRYFVEQGLELIIAQSFAKNFGLYGERAGAFHFVAAPGSKAQDVTKRVASQLAVLQRSEISNPPAYGARIASIVLNDKALFAEWEEDLRTMSGRIIEMRKSLKAELDKLDTPGNWDHITSQIGMFSFTGISEAQVLAIREKWHVYMTKNGRISMAGLNTSNVKYVAEALDDVVRHVK